MPQHNKHTQSEQVAQILLSTSQPTPYSYTLTRCAMCVKQKKPCMFIQRDPFFHDRSCVLCTAKSVPCIKPQTPLSPPRKHTPLQKKCGNFSTNNRKQLREKTQKNGRKSTQYTYVFNKFSKLTHTFWQKQALVTTQKRQPELIQHKRKRLTTLLSKEVANSEITRHIMLTSQSKCSMQNCSVLSTRKNPIQARVQCNKTWHSL